jgi:O-antigen/teichoic acid export membrane protein
MEGLGIWMIALSLMSLVNVVSAGLSASVITAIGRSSATNRRTSISEVATSAMFLAILWSGVVLTIVVPAAWLVEWGWLLGLSDPDDANAVQKLMAALSVLLAFGLVAVVPRQIMVGQMHGYVAYLLEFAGALLGAVALIIALHFSAPFWVLGLAFTAPSFLLIFLGGLFYLRRAGVELFAIRNLNLKMLHQLGHDSLRMAGYQSAFSVSSHSDLLLIGIILGTPASAVYGIAKRIFSSSVIFGETINYAQWPAMARADAAGDNEAVERMFRWTLVIGSSLAFGVSIFLALAYQSLVNIWLGHEVPTDHAILYGMVSWVLVATLVNTCDSVLRARNETLFLMRSMMLMALINIPVTLLL